MCLFIFVRSSVVLSRWNALFVCLLFCPSSTSEG
jgi:hypothetical protein